MHKMPQTDSQHIKTDVYFLCTLIHTHNTRVVYRVAIKRNAVQNESSVSYSFLWPCFLRDEEVDLTRELCLLKEFLFEFDFPTLQVGHL